MNNTISSAVRFWEKMQERVRKMEEEEAKLMASADRKTRAPIMTKTRVSSGFGKGMVRRGKTWDAIIARDDSARLRYGTTSLGHAWCTTDEGLKLAGAQPICDHKRNCGLVFSGNDPRPRSFKIKKAEKVTQSMQSDWLVANGENRVN